MDKITRMNVKDIDATTFLVKSIKISGFDLIIEKQDGNFIKVDDGLSSVVIGELSLKSVDNKVIGQTEILKLIGGENIGLESVFLDSLITTDVIKKDFVSKKENNAIVDEKVEEYLGKLEKQEIKIADLNKKLNEVKEKASSNISLDVSQGSGESEGENLINSLNESLKTESKAVSSAFKIQLPPPPETSVPAKSKSNDPAKSNDDVSVINPTVLDELKPFFINGGVDKVADSGKYWDNTTNIKKLIFSGQGTVGASVALSLGQQVYRTQVESDGNWRIDGLPVLEDGPYDYRLVATDVAGNQSQLDGQVVIDTRLRENSSRMDTASDTGVSSTDGITRYVRPVLSGQVEAGAEATLVLGGREYLLAVDSDGQWRWVPDADLAEGHHEYQVVARDVAGNRSTFTGGFTIDVTAPTAPVSQLTVGSDSGVAGDNITRNPTPLLSGMAGAGDSITVTLNGISYHTTASPQGNWTMLVGPLTEGRFEYTVSATDIAGNSAVAEGVVTIMATPPVLTGGLAPWNDSGSSDSDGITMHASPVFSGQGSVGASVALTLGQQVYRTQVGSDGNWRIEGLPVLEDGPYDYRLVATDVAGNQSGLDGKVVIDTRLSENSSRMDTASDTGVSSTDGITQNARPVLTGQLEKGAEATLVLGTQEYILAVGSDGQWQWTPDAALAEGHYQYQVVATDRAGNTSTFTGDFTLDITASVVSVPQLTVESDTGVAGDNITRNPTPLLSGMAGAGDSITVTLNGISYHTTASPQGNWTVLVGPLTEGRFEYTVSATDIAGNSAVAEGVVTIMTTPPVLTGGLAEESDSGASLTDGITQHASPVFSGQGRVGASVALTLGQQIYRTQVGADGNWRIEGLPVLEDGPYDYRLVATDVAGNQSGLDGKVVIDTRLSENSSRMDTASDTGVSSTDGITQNARPVLTGQLEKGAEATLVLGTQEYILAVGSDGQWQWTPDADLAEGHYQYQVVATDRAGNTSTFTGTFTVDTTAPALVSADLAPEQIVDPDISSTHASVPELKGVVEVGALVSLTWNGATKKIDVAADGSWNYYFNSGVVNGVNTYKIDVTDVAGNITSVDKTFTYFPEIDSNVNKSDLRAALDSLTDTGVAGDQITNIKKPTLTGVAPVGHRASLSIGGVAYNIDVQTDGSWSFDIPVDLREGANEYLLTAKTGSGADSATYAGVIYVDTTPPSAQQHLKFDSNISDDFITNVPNNILTGAIEKDVSIDITYKGMTSKPDVNSDGTWSYNITLVEGDNAITIVKTDLAGNITTVNKTVTLDTIAPVLSEVTLLNDTGVKNDWSTTDKTPLIQIKAAAGLFYSVSVSGTTHLLNGTVGSDGLARIKIPDDVFVDNHLLQSKDLMVKVFDAAGNESSQNVTLKYLNQEISVAGDLADASDSGAKGDMITNVKYASLNGTFTGVSNPAVIYNGSVIIDNVNYALAIVRDNNKWKWSFDNSDKVEFRFGKNEMDVVINDNFGNRISQHKTVIVTDVNYRLKPETDTGTWGDYITSNRQPVLEGKTEPNGQVNVFIVNSAKSITAQADATGHWEIDLSSGVPFEEGAYDYKLQVTEGNDIISFDGKFVIDLSVGPLTSSLENGARYSTTDKPVLVGKTDINSVLTLEINGKTYTTSSNNKGDWRFKIPDALPHGHIDYTISVRDENGNESGARPFTLDVDTAPMFMKLTLDDHEVSSTTSGHWAIIADKHHYITGITLPGATVRFNVGYRGTGAVQADSDGKFRIHTGGAWVESLLSRYKAELIITTVGGRSTKYTSWGVSFVDTAYKPLTVEVTDEVNGEVPSNLPKFTGSGSAYAKIKLVINNIEYNTRADLYGKWALSVSDALPDGINNYTITSTLLMVVQVERLIAVLLSIPSWYLSAPHWMWRMIVGF
ncbi:hypothetical protein EHN07_05450 [Buttiauxella warmboldiae]|uniref:Bacterial Ig-like domain-containing protein n=1 Tax=Buttiauxella warmboldiae TaxID=82993 RepID=A0A3N5DPX3_9ENTR|nr:Ig-like domain-containing protein [Buttiauxella warmboldiae]RPH29647.1 hypothetical protein EHN07_05450 [Buttiauxella warmboldiae]